MLVQAHGELVAVVLDVGALCALHVVQLALQEVAGHGACPNSPVTMLGCAGSTGSRIDEARIGGVETQEIRRIQGEVPEQVREHVQTPAASPRGLYQTSEDLAEGIGPEASNRRGRSRCPNCDLSKVMRTYWFGVSLVYTPSTVNSRIRVSCWISEMRSLSLLSCTSHLCWELIPCLNLLGCKLILMEP